MTDDWHRTWHAVRDVFGSKWAFHVVRALADRERGFNELKRELGCSAKTLSARLRELRCLDVVEKEVHDTSPPTTTYRLTERGGALAAVMADVEDLVDVVACPGGDCPVPSPDARDAPTPSEIGDDCDDPCDCEC